MALKQFKDSRDRREHDGVPLLAPTHRPTSMLATLRFTRRLQASVLLLWVCCMGVAAASPWLGSQAVLDWVCSGNGGVRLVALESLPHDPAQPRGMDCPMCLPMGTPPPVPVALAAREAFSDAPGVDAPELQREHDSALRPPVRAPPRFFLSQR